MRKVFFDTNVFVYLFVGDPIKADIAEALIQHGGIISVQVLNEFISVTRGKYRFSWDKVEESLTAIRDECDVIPLDLAIHQQALELCQETNLSIYDGLIVAAALTAGCDTLYSEDMNHGQKIGSLKIINPFRPA
jgi:predicted nucleic acid-binding protein